MSKVSMLGTLQATVQPRASASQSATRRAKSVAMNQDQVRDILEDLERGTTTVAQAQAQLVDMLRRIPFEDLGFARVDHHRAVRQGLPEVIFGAGKTVDQVAAIAESLVSAGHPLLVTRTDEATYSAVQQVVPNAQFHSAARAITYSNGSTPSGKGIVLIAAAGTSDIPVAEEARVSAELLGKSGRHLV